jgi:hypothetical protein
VQEHETRLDRWIELKTSDRNATAHFDPGMFVTRQIEDVVERNAVQRVAGVSGQRAEQKRQAMDEQMAGLRVAPSRTVTCNSNWSWSPLLWSSNWMLGTSGNGMLGAKAAPYASRGNNLRAALGLRRNLFSLESAK